MAASTDEIEIDLAAADAESAQKVADAKKNGANGTDLPSVEVETASPTPPRAEKTVVSPEDGLEKLKNQLETEKTARIAAEQRASDASARAAEASAAEARARGDVQTTQLDLIKGAIEQVTQQNDLLEAQYEAALTAQDFKGAAKVQRQMADNSAKLAQLETGKTALEKAPKPTPRPVADPVEQFAAQLSPASAAWVRAHPDYVRDPKKNQLMLAAHQMALARGHSADTPEYFGSIEKSLDIAPPVTHTEEIDPMADTAKPVNGSGRVPAAAPVSRGGNGQGSRPNIVKLSAAEVEIAESMGMTPQEYARNKMALKKEGKLS